MFTIKTGIMSEVRAARRVRRYDLFEPGWGKSSLPDEAFTNISSILGFKNRSAKSFIEVFEPNQKIIGSIELEVA